MVALRMPRAVAGAADAGTLEHVGLRDLEPAIGSRSSLSYAAFEVLFSAAVLILLAPVLLIVAVLIKLDSPGPVFFVQKRLTKGARPFDFIKFRTMYVDGDARFPQLSPGELQRQETAQLRLQRPDDPRVTRIGRWLRKTSIDELPNFWNVITRDMALVGPRPEMAEMLCHYRGADLAKFSVAPGITGYAQIYGRGDLTFLETLDYDLRYVKERSLKVDVLVLLHTVRCVFFCKGAM
jgi:lipopolysaccharide/colanic/teichoic acid biosynthesis glycosyltransferase